MSAKSAQCCERCGAKSKFPRQNVKNTRGSDHFWTFRCRFAWQAQGDCAPCQKRAKRDGSVAVSKTMAGVGHLKRICKDAFRMAGSTRDMFIRDVRRSGRWFPERGCILEHQIFRFAKMILCDRCSTSYDLASLVCGKRSTLDRRSGKNAKRIGTSPSALQSTFHFWRSLAELLRFWCCQVQKLRKSRRICLFLMLSSSKIEEVSQNWLRFAAFTDSDRRLTDRQIASFSRKTDCR